jgi:hypothetical protein
VTEALQGEMPSLTGDRGATTGNAWAREGLLYAHAPPCTVRHMYTVGILQGGVQPRETPGAAAAEHDGRRRHRVSPLLSLTLRFLSLTADISQSKTDITQSKTDISQSASG